MKALGDSYKSIMLVSFYNSCKTQITLRLMKLSLISPAKMGLS